MARAACCRQKEDIGILDHTEDPQIRNPAQHMRDRSTRRSAVNINLSIRMKFYPQAVSRTITRVLHSSWDPTAEDYCYCYDQQPQKEVRKKANATTTSFENNYYKNSKVRICACCLAVPPLFLHDIMMRGSIPQCLLQKFDSHHMVGGDAFDSAVVRSRRLVLVTRQH